MLKLHSLRAVAAVLLCLLGDVSAAVEPCAPFEGGRVEPGLIAAMRKAASEGRMYRIDAEKSSVGFCVRHFPFQEFRGEFRNLVGGLALPPDPAQYGHALLLIHSASLVSESSDLVPLVIGHSFFDAERFPEILYVGRRFVWLDDRQARIYGELTLHGKTRPVIFNVEIERVTEDTPEADRRIRLRGTTQVNRIHFDMDSYQFFVSDTVRLCLSVELVLWKSE